MNFFKRAWFAVIRKPSRSIIMLIIFVAIANLVLTGLAIQHATQTASVEARKQLGGSLTFSFDTQKARQQAMSQNNATSDSITGFKAFRVDALPVTEDMVSAIAKQKNIVADNIIVNTSAMASGFSPFVTTSSSSSSSSSSSAPSNQQGFALRNGNGNQQNVKISFPDVSIVGLSSTQLYEDFNSGTSSAKLTSTLKGHENGITPADKGKHYVIISSDLATLNKLSVGNTIKMNAQNSTTIITYTVVGIYSQSSNSDQSSTFGGGGMRDMTFSDPANKIYTDYGSALELKNLASAAESSNTNSNTRSFGGMTSTPGIDKAIFYIDDPANVDAAKSDISKIKSIDWTKFTIDADDTQYEAMMKPINQVASFSQWVVLLVGIVGAVILALIMLLNVRERMYETGVLLSMGESKIKLVLQYVSEMLVIAVIAFGLSIFTGTYIAQGIGDALVANQISANNAASSQQAQNYGNGMGGGGPRQFALNQMRINGGGINNNVKPITDLKITLTFTEVAELILAGLIIILIATIIPAVSIMRFNPKNILTRAG